jgi:predicted restriction endonuclease
MWDGCSVTGCVTFDLLAASHIKPWSASNNEEWLDLYNGFLLVAHLDKAFDSGLISFDSKGQIMISNAFNEQQLIGITQNIKIALRPRREKYLQHHRTAVFKKA